MTYKSLNGKGPKYLSDMFNKDSVSYSLRSFNNDVFNVPKTNKKCCSDRAFSVAAPQLWNDLPIHIKCAKDVKDFKVALKTHLFKIAYNL